MLDTTLTPTTRHFRQLRFFQAPGLAVTDGSALMLVPGLQTTAIQLKDFHIMCIVNNETVRTVFR